MYVLDNPAQGYRGLIFLAQPRTASTTISMELMRMGAKRIGGHHEASDLILEEYYVVSGVRDHVDALLSFYGRESKQGRPVPGTVGLSIHDMEPDQYAEWFLWNHKWVRSQRLYWRYRFVSDAVYHYETLVGDWEHICDRMQIPRLEFTKRYQKSKHPPRLSEAQTLRVNRFFEREREELGYPV